jgi:Divergent InlB B-repeat domain
VSCPTSSFCAASGFGEISTSTNPSGGEGAWVEGTSIGGFMPSISCPSAGFCAAADINPPGVWTSTNPTGGAVAWKDTELAASSLESISCPSRSFCAVGDVSNRVRVSTNPTGGAATWQLGGKDPEPSEGDGITGIACPTTAFCAAADDTGHVLESADPTGAEEAWTLAPIDAAHSLTGISCPVASFCAAVDASGNLFIGTGTPSSQHTLMILETGTGAGVIASAPFGITCGTACTHAFDNGTPVTLTATPAADSTFAGWSGSGCAGTGFCEISMASDVVMTATFTANEGGGEIGGSVGGSGGTLPNGGDFSPAPTPTPAPVPHKKPLKCHKGFKKRKVHGKTRCVKVKKSKR